MLRFACLTPLVFAVFAASANDAHAEDPAPISEASGGWAVSEFQIGGVMATQGGGSSFGPIGKYLPHYDLDRLQIGLELGLTSFNDSGNSDFLIIHYGAFGGYAFSKNWDVRLSAGAETWTAGNGTAAYVGPEVIYHFDSRIAGFFDGIYVSYEAVFQSNFANLFSAGLDLRF